MANQLLLVSVPQFKSELINVNGVQIMARVGGSGALLLMTHVSAFLSE